MTSNVTSNQPTNDPINGQISAPTRNPTDAPVITVDSPTKNPSTPPTENTVDAENEATINPSETPTVNPVSPNEDVNNDPKIENTAAPTINRPTVQNVTQQTNNPTSTDTRAPIPTFESMFPSYISTYTPSIAPIELNDATNATNHTWFSPTRDDLSSLPLTPSATPTVNEGLTSAFFFLLLIIC